MLCVPYPGVPPENVFELALYKPHRWPAEHRTVTVRFLDGDGNTQLRVAMAILNSWNKASGLQFQFVSGRPADVRVSFRGVGNWAYPGTYCLSIPTDQPTMVLSLNQDSAPNQVQYVALHEFGHAMGFLHEHESPNAAIPWDFPALYAYYQARGWDKTMVDNQVLARVDAAVAEAGTYDPHSIMHYGIPPELVLDRVGRGGAKELSAQDIAMAQQWYGLPPVVEERRAFVPIVRR